MSDTEEVIQTVQPPVRIIAVDMDGTLLGSDGKVSERNLAAMKAAEAVGVEVVVLSCRAPGDG